MINVFERDFPFNEICSPSGDYFDTFDEALSADVDFEVGEENVWSVQETEEWHERSGNEEPHRKLHFSYGPGKHWVNVIGFIVTVEEHDGNTYYEEVIELPF